MASLHAINRLRSVDYASERISPFLTIHQSALGTRVHVPLRAVDFQTDRVSVLVKERVEGWRHSAYFDIKVIIFMEVISMPAVTILNLSGKTHRALRVLVAHHGRNTEAEIRDIVEATVRPAERVKLGSLLTGHWSRRRASRQ